jgi:cupin 2 domain-containing protein
MDVANLLDDACNALAELHTDGEVVDVLATGSCKIERIVSMGGVSPHGFWYDQERDEWVMVVEGRARLLFDGSTESVELACGDCINIPAHTRHRVEWTDPEVRTVWLAVHYEASSVARRDAEGPQA